jgi:hypothetical protein
MHPRVTSISDIELRDSMRLVHRFTSAEAMDICNAPVFMGIDLHPVQYEEAEVIYIMSC